MSIAAVSWAMKVRVGSSTRKAVLIALCNYADQDGFCWPSQETIAGDTELTDRSVRTALAELEESGFIERTARPRRADKTRQSDLVRITFKPSTIRKELPEALPETDDQTIRKDVPDLPEGASGKSSGEPLLERGEGARARPARATLLPENWKPNSKNVEAAVAVGLNAKQVERAARKFRLYHAEIGRPVKDWDAAWARWVDREAELVGAAREPELPLGTQSGTKIGEQIFLAENSEEFRAWAETRPRGIPRHQSVPSGPHGWWFPSRWPPGHPRATEAAA